MIHTRILTLKQKENTVFEKTFIGEKIADQKRRFLPMLNASLFYYAPVS